MLARPAGDRGCFLRKPPRRPQPGPSARQFRMNIEPDRIHQSGPVRSSLTAILGSHLTSVRWGMAVAGELTRGS